MKKIINTHMYLHRQGLKIINNDIKNINQYLCEDTLISGADIKKMKENLHILNSFRDTFIENAKVPDERETKCYYEEYEFIANKGMKITRTKLELPFMFSQHFHSPNEGCNYISKFNMITEKLCKSKNSSIKELSYNIKKQGLTYNALGLFLTHACQAIEICKKNDYNINEEAVEELSLAAHYLEDMNESHHATNKIGIGFLSFVLWIPPFKNINFKTISNHSAFEEYAKKHKEKYSIKSISEVRNLKSLTEVEKKFWSSYTYDMFLKYDLQHNREGINCFKEVCNWFAIYSNDFASGTINFETGDTGDRVLSALSLDKNEWNKNLEQTLPMAQLSVSVFLFTFLLYISNPCLFNFKDNSL